MLMWQYCLYQCPCLLYFNQVFIRGSTKYERLSLNPNPDSFNADSSPRSRRVQFSALCWGQHHNPQFYRMRGDRECNRWCNQGIESALVNDLGTIQDLFSVLRVSIAKDRDRSHSACQPTCGAVHRRGASGGLLHQSTIRICDNGRGRYFGIPMAWLLIRKPRMLPIRCSYWGLPQCLSR